MARRSTKEDKNIYFLAREQAGYTREQASERIGYISADRIEKIENERIRPQPDDVLAMAAGYQDPYLCNHYCAQECPIGQKYTPKVEVKDVSQLTLELMVGLTKMNLLKDRLMEIVVDGKISDEEQKDFRTIREQLDQMSIAVEAMKLWISQEDTALCES